MCWHLRNASTNSLDTVEKSPTPIVLQQHPTHPSPTPATQVRSQSPSSSCLNADATNSARDDDIIEEGRHDPYDDFFRSSPTPDQPSRISSLHQFWHAISQHHLPAVKRGFFRRRAHSESNVSPDPVLNQSPEVEVRVGEERDVAARHPEVVEVYAVRGFQGYVAMAPKKKPKPPVVAGGFLKSTCNVLRDLLYSGTSFDGIQSDTSFPRGCQLAILTYDTSLHFYDLTPASSPASMIVVSDLEEDRQACTTVAISVSDTWDGALLDFLVDCEISQETDAGHVRFSRYMRHERVSHMNGAVDRFQLVLDRCPVDHPDHAAALTNFAWARLQGYIHNDLQNIDTTTSLFHEALALRPQGHPDHILYLYNLISALIWRYSKERTAVFIHESLQLCCKLLPLCPEGTYLRSIGVDIEELESGHPHLARKFSELSKRVSNAAQGSAAITDRAAADRAATEYRKLIRQWDAVVAEIRDLRGFSRFLLPPLYEDLQVAARNGPVIILIASKYSCSAIVVPTSGEPHHVRFPRITLPLKVYSMHYRNVI
ncbi:hypothetical protein DEU56DRAFT_755797 [Suillus clintonianus]|uniref:uncharacterized protein n=1 Tax=Suillus clintonianus TaxID=1904413 RepID=UPI001B871A8D|nr:uncharacterized protein DEU56DRAFT_755797 [Suillus clintonianus]KAG2138496.1 hypothetical protein DEU56DRAFT_755797 [Suillus clintonianus]